MDTLTLNHMLNEALLGDLGGGMDSIAGRLTDLFDGWRRSGADPGAIEFLGTIIGELGWWRGRIDAALVEPSGTH